MTWVLSRTLGLSHSHQKDGDCHSPSLEWRSFCFWVFFSFYNAIIWNLFHQLQSNMHSVFVDFRLTQYIDTRIERGKTINCSAWLKLNTKLTLKTTTTHPPKTFRRVLGIAGGQNLACMLHVGHWTKPQSFNPSWWSLPPPLGSKKL